MSETTEDYWTRHKRESQEAVDRGENCSRCGEWIFRLTYPGHRQQCFHCKGIDKPGELGHKTLIRCPRCGETFDPHGSDQYQVFGEGHHEVSCLSCDHVFEVETTVSFYFTSPEREAPEPEPADETED